LIEYINWHFVVVKEDLPSRFLTTETPIHLAHSVSDFTKTVQWTSRKELLVCSNHLAIYDKNLNKIQSITPVSNCHAAIETSNAYVVIRQSHPEKICLEHYSQGLQRQFNLVEISGNGDALLSCTYDHRNHQVLQLNNLTKKLSSLSCFNSGSYKSKFLVKLTSVKSPRRLHALQDGCILVSDYTNNSLHKLQISGTPVWSCERVDKPLGIGHDDVRRLIYVASENGYIYELSNEGIYMQHFYKPLHDFSKQTCI